MGICQSMLRRDQDFTLLVIGTGVSFLSEKVVSETKEHFVLFCFVFYEDAIFKN